MGERVGVLAFGSLIQEPRREIKEAEAERRTGIRTPFRVEFARSSSGRDGAPTLVPVTEGGGHVEATVIVLREGVSVSEARDIVYRREIQKVGKSNYTYRPDPGKKDQVFVEVLPNFAGLDWVLFTRIAANILGTQPEELARLAIKSAQAPIGQKRRDGISYLASALAHGIRTPLSEDYHDQILEMTDAADLEEAWEKARVAVEEAR